MTEPTREKRKRKDWLDRAIEAAQADPEALAAARALLKQVGTKHA